MTQETQHRLLVLVQFSCRARVDSLFSYRAKVLPFDQGKGDFRPPSINYGHNSSGQFRTFHARLQMNRSQLQMHNKKLSVFASVSFNYLYNRGQIYTLPKKVLWNVYGQGRLFRLRKHPSPLLQTAHKLQLRFPWEQIWRLRKTWRWSKNPWGPKPLT